MFIQLDRDGTLEGLQVCLENFRKNPAIKTILILACAGNKLHHSIDRLNTVLQKMPLPLFGGIFPQIIHQGERLEKGTIVAGFSSPLTVHVLEQLSNEDKDFDESIDRLIPNIGENRTMFVFFDGFAKRLNDLVDSLFTLFGVEVNYIGGGACCIFEEVLDLTPQPCIFTNNGLISDAALLVLTTRHSGIGVSHGWTETGGPMKVTEAEGNSITSLDWQPAFPVYRRIIEKYSGKKITPDNFFSIAKEFPFGLTRLFQESVVRDPFFAQGDSLVFGIPIPAETFVDILSGDRLLLPKAVNKALHDAKHSFRGRQENACMFFFDCISRVFYLEEHITEEIAAVAGEGLPLIGAFTLGEIANSGKAFLEYYNKTSVVGLLEDE